jgi:hypothetical protein
MLLLLPFEELTKKAIGRDGTRAAPAGLLHVLQPPQLIGVGDLHSTATSDAGSVMLQRPCRRFAIGGHTSTYSGQRQK